MGERECPFLNFDETFCLWNQFLGSDHCFSPQKTNFYVLLWNPLSNLLVLRRAYSKSCAHSFQLVRSVIYPSNLFKFALVSSDALDDARAFLWTPTISIECYQHVSRAHGNHDPGTRELLSLHLTVCCNEKWMTTHHHTRPPAGWPLIRSDTHHWHTSSVKSPFAQTCFLCLFCSVDHAYISKLQIVTDTSEDGILLKVSVTQRSDVCRSPVQL